MGVLRWLRSCFRPGSSGPRFGSQGSCSQPAGLPRAGSDLPLPDPQLTETRGREDSSPDSPMQEPAAPGDIGIGPIAFVSHQRGHPTRLRKIRPTCVNLAHIAVGKNKWYHSGVGECTTHFRTYFSGWIESDVHWDDSAFDPWPYGYGSKNRYQNGTLVSGNMDHHLRFVPVSF